ncbi:MAG TPA: tetratricopeptide repeat protein [Candidatus Brocadiia bacterium]|nr:tetratricopeptide repeat protein [Candidatus Brocadiia bacterium]
MVQEQEDNSNSTAPDIHAHDRRADSAWISLIVFCAFIYGVTSERDADLWTHLSYGREVARTFSIPRTDLFTYTADGREWVNHSWLSGTLFYLVYRAGGVSALIILRAAMLAFTAALTYFTARTGGGSRIAAGLSAVILLINLHHRLVTRPFVFSWGLLAVICLISELQRQRMQASGNKDCPEHKMKRSDKATFFILPVIFVLWANLHVGFLIGLCVLSAHTTDSILSTLLYGKRRNIAGLRNSGAQTKFWIVLMIFCLTATLINPFGIKSHSYFLIVSRNFAYSRGIVEWMPPSWIPGMWPFWTMIICAVALLALNYRCVTLSEILVTAGFGLLAISSVRHVEFFAIACAPILARHLTIFARASICAYDSFSRHAIALRRTALISVITLLTGLAVYRISSGDFSLHIDDYALPVKACRFLKTQPIEGRIFNSYGWGGYLTWELYPRKFFIDGRNDVCDSGIYAAALAIIEGWTTVPHGQTAPYLPSGIELDASGKSSPVLSQVLDAWDINVLFLHYDPSRMLLTHLFGNNAWKIVYWDNTALIAVRNIPANAAIIKSRQFHNSCPLVFLAHPPRPEQTPEVESELQAKINEDPGCSTAVFLLGVLRLVAADYDTALSHFQKCLVMGHGEAGTCANIAICLLETGRIGESLAAIRRARRLEPNNNNHILIEARCLIALNRFHEARTLIERILKTDPINAGARRLNDELTARETKHPSHSQ